MFDVFHTLKARKMSWFFFKICCTATTLSAASFTQVGCVR